MKNLPIFAAPVLQRIRLHGIFPAVDEAVLLTMDEESDLILATMDHLNRIHGRDLSMDCYAHDCEFCLAFLTAKPDMARSILAQIQQLGPARDTEPRRLEFLTELSKVMAGDHQTELWREGIRPSNLKDM